MDGIDTSHEATAGRLLQPRVPKCLVYEATNLRLNLSKANPRAEGPESLGPWVKPSLEERQEESESYRELPCQVQDDLSRIKGMAGL